MKDILIIANFCGDFSKTDNGRFMYLCNELSKDNQVEIITSDFSHGKKQHKEPLIHTWPFKITFLHEAGYKKNISIRRFVSHHSWGIEVKRYLEQREKPDIVYCAVPSLTASYEAAKYCEKNGIRFIIDVQDLWPEAFRMAFNVPLVSDLLFAPFNHIANGIYRRADAVCGVSQTYVDRALRVNKKNAEGNVVYLGTDLANFDRNVANNPVKKPEGELWIGYCGTLGASYDISVVIDALEILRKRGITPPKFIVLGDGERKLEFEQRAHQKKVNCLFPGRLPYDQMCGWLKACDIAANPIMHNAAQSIINKHGDYASAGLPVVNTQESLEYCNLVEEYKMGFNCRNGDADEVAKCIKKMIEDEEVRIQMGANARRCAEEKFNRKESYRELMQKIL